MSTTSGQRIRRSTRKNASVVGTSVGASTATRRSFEYSAVGRRRTMSMSSGLTMGAPQCRRNDTVSMTSSTTETRLASRAPPDSDTTPAMSCGVIPTSETCVA